MEGFTLIDAIVAGVLVVSGVLAYARGLVREVMSIVGWVAAAIIAFALADTVAPLMREIPFLGDFLADSCELTVIAAFTAVFAVSLVVVSFFTPLLSSLMERMHLGKFDQALGLVFGILRGMLLVAVAFVVYNRLGGGTEIVDNSRSASVFGNVSQSIEERLPDEAPAWITETYESLMKSCPAPDTALLAPLHARG